jgi:hypothetical protein
MYACHANRKESEATFNPTTVQLIIYHDNFAGRSCHIQSTLYVTFSEIIGISNLVPANI